MKFHVQVNDSNVVLNGKPVENPAARVLLGGLVVILLGLSVIWAGLLVVLSAVAFVLCICLVIVLIPLWVPGHFVLRHYGRQGFYVNEPGSTRFDFSANSFRKEQA